MARPRRAAQFASGELQMADSERAGRSTPSPSNLTRRARRRPARFRQKTKKSPKRLVLFPAESGNLRPHERLTPSAVFKTAAFNHSATLPEVKHYTEFTSQTTASAYARCIHYLQNDGVGPVKCLQGRIGHRTDRIKIERFDTQRSRTLGPATQTKRETYWMASGWRQDDEKLATRLINT